MRFRRRFWIESQRVKTRRAKTSENFAEEKMFAEDISEDASEDRRYHFYWFFKYLWISSKSSRKIAFFWEVFGSFYALGFYPWAVSRFWINFLRFHFCCDLIHFCVLLAADFLSGKSKWGLSNGGLRPLSAICAQSSTIVHFSSLLGPFLRGTFVAKWRQS